MRGSLCPIPAARSLAAPLLLWCLQDPTIWLAPQASRSGVERSRAACALSARKAGRVALFPAEPANHGAPEANPASSPPCCLRTAGLVARSGAHTKAGPLVSRISAAMGVAPLAYATLGRSSDPGAAFAARDLKATWPPASLRVGQTGRPAAVSPDRAVGAGV